MKFNTDTHLSVSDAEQDAAGDWIDLRFNLGLSLVVSGTDSASGAVTLVGSQDKITEIVLDTYTVVVGTPEGDNKPDLFWPWVRFKYTAGASGAGTVTVKATIKGA